MGINISVRKVTGKTTERQDWFDYLRYSGDRDFVVENEFDFIDTDVVVEEQELARPKDFNKCREWVKEKVYEGNQQRFLNALDKMEADETLCFTWSW